MSYPQICRLELTPLQLEAIYDRCMILSQCRGAHSAGAAAYRVIQAARVALRRGDTDFVVGIRSGDSEPYFLAGTIL